MIVNIRKRGNYHYQLKKLILQYGDDFLQTVEEQERLFKSNPKDTRLRNHSLKKRMNGKWAFSIDEDIRIIYKKLGKQTVQFLDIGTHEQVYGRPKPK